MSRSTHTERYERFQTLLVQARKEAGLTQAAVAPKLGKPQSYVAKYERGERRLDVVEFLDIVRVLGGDPGDILNQVD